MSKRISAAAIVALSLASLTACGDDDADDADAASTETETTTATETETASSVKTDGPWEYDAPGYEDITVKLDEFPDVVVADAYTTQAVWPYGVRPAATWGYGQSEEAMDDVDTSKLEILGKDGEFSLEKLAALNPDVIIGYGNEAGTGYTWWDEKTTKQVAEVAPYLPVDFGGRTGAQTVDSVIESFQDLAESLGGDINSPEVKEDKAEYEEAKEELKKVFTERDDITVALTAPVKDQVWFANDQMTQVKLLKELGINMVGPETEGEAWASETWENMPALKADVILTNTQGSEGVLDNELFKKTEAAKAGQTYTWDDKRPYTYDEYADWLEDLAEQIEDAKDVVKS